MPDRSDPEIACWVTGSLSSLLDHRFALESPMRLSAPDKKSFSIDNWPIWRVAPFMLGP